MRKLIAVAMSLILVLIATNAVSAIGITVKPVTTQKVNTDYGFSYSEFTDENYRTVRSYKKQDSLKSFDVSQISTLSTQSAATTDETKAILNSLGMSEDFIDELSGEDLQDYANSEEITSIVSYTKTDVDGNTVNISEDEAFSVTGVTLPPHVLDDDVVGSTTNPTTIVEDSYMRLVFIVAYKGDGVYKYSADAEWLTTPTWRSRDCFGIAVQNSSIYMSTASAWFSYNCIEVNYYNGTRTNTSKQISFSNSNNDFEAPSADAWGGTAITFYLPSNVVTDYNSFTYCDFKVHLEFESEVSYPTIASTFNATASYDHSLVTVLPSANVDITGSDVQTHWGFSAALSSDTRIAYFDEPFHYVPD